MVSGAAIVGAVAYRAGFDQRRIADKRLLGAHREAGAERMGRIEPIGAVALDTVGVRSCGVMSEAMPFNRRSPVGPG